MRFQAVIGIAITGSLLAGCGDTVATTPMRSATAAARALPEARARAILDRYATVNNEANAKVSDALLRSIETGPFLEADLATSKRIRAKAEKKIEPFTYRNPQFFIPRVSPAWFGVLAQSTHPDWGSEFLVFADVGGGTYKATIGIWIAEGRKLPAIARGVDGSATAVTTRPALSAGAKLAEYLTAVANGGHAPAGISSEPSIGREGKQWAKEMKRNNRPGEEDAIRWRARIKPVYALKTADGGALVLTVGTSTEDYRLTRPGYEIEPDSRYLGLGRKHYLHEFTGTMLWQFLASVPPRGPVSLLAEGGDTIAAAGN